MEGLAEALGEPATAGGKQREPASVLTTGAPRTSPPFGDEPGGYSPSAPEHTTLRHLFRGLRAEASIVAGMTKEDILRLTSLSACAG